MLRKILITLFFIVGLVSCQSTSSTPLRQYEYLTDGSALLVEVENNVMLSRFNTDEFYPVNIGVVINLGDSLQVAGSGKATLLCSDFETVATIDVTQPVGIGLSCPSTSTEAIFRDGQRASTSRQVGGGVFPQVLYPRRTVIMTFQPTIRWRPVVIATSYNVSIEHNNRPIWTVGDITATSWTYDSISAPALQANTTYKVVVTTDSGQSSNTDPTSDTEFTILSSQDQTTIAKRLEQIEALPLDDQGRQLAAIAYLLHHNLLGDAVAQLEVLNQATSAPALQLHQANLLHDIALYNDAHQVYTATVTLAEEQGDAESQAAAYVGLARLAPTNQARETHYQAAITLYTDLGNQAQVNLLQQELANSLFTP